MKWLYAILAVAMINGVIIATTGYFIVPTFVASVITFWLGWQWGGNK